MQHTDSTNPTADCTATGPEADMEASMACRFCRTPLQHVVVDLGTIDVPTSGSVRVAGNDLAQMTESQLARYRAGATSGVLRALQPDGDLGGVAG